MRVRVRNNKVLKALSVFRAKTKPIVREYREREEYIKPTERKRRQHRSAVAREKRRQLNDRPRRDRSY